MSCRRFIAIPTALKAAATQAASIHLTQSSSVSDGRQQDRPEIVDVGQRRPGDELIPERAEESMGVVVGERRLRIDAEPARPRERVRSDIRAGNLLGAVEA